MTTFNPIAGCLLLAALTGVMTSCAQQAEVTEDAVAEVRITPSRVAVFATEVISDVTITLDRTVVVEDEHGRGLRASGMVTNQGPQALHGLELSLTLEQPEGVGIGGHLLQAYMHHPLPSGSSEVIMIDFPALSAVDLGQNVTTRVTILRKLDGPTPDGSTTISGRSESEPYQATASDQKEKQEVQHTAGSTSDAELEEEIDGDDRPTEGDGG